jgi:protein ImuB
VRLAAAGGSALSGELIEVTGWAGPWPVEERWWVPGEARRLVRFQLTLADGRALLMTLTAGRWQVEASYD